MISLHLPGPGKPPAPNATTKPPLTGEAYEKAKAVCAACPWCNKEFDTWICEHIGCLPCVQRKNGGLLAMLKQAGAR